MRPAGNHPPDGVPAVSGFTGQDPGPGGRQPGRILVAHPPRDSRSRRPWPPSSRWTSSLPHPSPTRSGWPAPVWPPTSSAGWGLPCAWAAAQGTSMGSHRATGDSTDAVTTQPTRSSSRHPSSRAGRPGRAHRRTARGGRTVRPTSPAVAVTAPAPPATAATGSSSNCRFDDTITFDPRSLPTSAVAGQHNVWAEPSPKQQVAGSSPARAPKRPSSQVRRTRRVLTRGPSLSPQALHSARRPE